MKKLELKQMESIEGGTADAKCYVSTLSNEIGWGIAFGLIVPGAGWYIGAAIGAAIGASAGC